VRYGYHLVTDCRKANQGKKSHKVAEMTLIHHFNTYTSITATKAKPFQDGKQADILLSNITTFDNPAARNLYLDVTSTNPMGVTNQELINRAALNHQPVPGRAPQVRRQLHGNGVSLAPFALETTGGHTDRRTFSWGKSSRRTCVCASRRSTSHDRPVSENLRLTPEPAALSHSSGLRCGGTTKGDGKPETRVKGQAHLFPPFYFWRTCLRPCERGKQRHALPTPLPLLAPHRAAAGRPPCWRVKCARPRAAGAAARGWLVLGAGWRAPGATTVSPLPYSRGAGAQGRRGAQGGGRPSPRREAGRPAEWAGCEEREGLRPGLLPLLSAKE
jgi:hypothetical protein